MNLHFVGSVAACVLGAAVPAWAETEDRPWDVAAELGAIATSGNTETTTVQGKIDASHDMTRWNNEYIVSFLFKEDEVTDSEGIQSTVKTAERVAASAKTAYKLQQENANLFLYGSHTNDEFAAYEKYTTVALGYGLRLWDSDTAQLNVELGPGYYWAEQSVEGATVTEESAIGRGAVKFDWQLTDSAEFKQVISTEAGPDNTRTTSDTSLSSRINSAMQMKVGFSLTTDTDVAQGKEKTDTTTYVNLVYNF